MLTFEYMIEFCDRHKDYTVYSQLKHRGVIVIVGVHSYTRASSARRGLSRIISLMSPEVVVINVGSL